MYIYEIISGTNNRNSTEYFKTVHLNLKAIFFWNSTLDRNYRVIKESFSNILQNVLPIGDICLQIDSLGEK